MFHKLIPYTKLQIRILHAFRISPYKWPQKSRFPFKIESKLDIFMYRVNFMVQLIYILLITPHFLSNFGKENWQNDIASRMLGLVFLDCFNFTFCMRAVFLWKGDDGLRMMRSYLYFEDKNPEG